MKKLGFSLFAVFSLSLFVLACGDKIEYTEHTETFENIRPDMFIIHDTTYSFYEDYVVHVIQKNQNKEEEHITIASRGFNFEATIQEEEIRFESSDLESYQLLQISGKGILRRGELDLFYEVSTPPHPTNV